jgi:hypothetical protein
MRQRLDVWLVAVAVAVAGVGEAVGLGLGLGLGLGRGVGRSATGHDMSSLARTYPTSGELIATQPAAPSSASVTCSLGPKVLTV